MLDETLKKQSFECYLMDTVRFPYRSEEHLTILDAINESGAWENQNLDVKYDFFIEKAESHNALANREVDFVGGSHITPYSERTRGDEWVYLGQTRTHVTFSLATRPDSQISSIPDLAGNTVIRGSGHPGLNERLLLHQHGLQEENGDYETVAFSDEEKLDAIQDNKGDAALLTPPVDLHAERRGLRIVDRYDLPMVLGTTVSSTKPYVEENEDIVIRFIKGIIAGIAHFKNNPEERIQFMQEEYDYDEELATHIYNEENAVLAPKLYPTPQAIQNVYQEAIWTDEAALEVEPFELWDFSYLRDIVDSGFVDELYY